jgi:predicted dehydrogenase
MVKIGVIGCGYWGPNIVRNFYKLKDCQVSAVVDLSDDRLNYIRGNFPKIKACTDHAELINDPDIDGVAIITPVASHFNLAKQALLAGKHVLLTKPMTASVAEAEKLVALAEKHQLTLMVDHTFIYSSPVLKIRELIDQGELGQIYYYDSVRVNLGLFQNDVNVLWDLAPHDFSILAYLIDKEPISVSAVGAKPINSGNYKHESVVYVTIRFADDTLAHVHVSWLSPVKIRRTLIGGSNKMVVYDHLDPDNQIKIFDKGVELRSMEEKYKALVQYRVGDMYAPKIDQTEALEVECQHFVDCIKNGTKPITDGYDGLRVVQLLETAQRSMENNGEVIMLESEKISTH